MHYNNKWQWGALLSVCVISIANGQEKTPNTLEKGAMSLSHVWEKAVSYNKTIKMQELRLQSSEEQIKDAKAERLPELGVAGEYARVSNMPLYENGLFNSPEQIPVIHAFYKVGGDAYFNIYNGNKTNIKIAEEETHHQLVTAQKEQSTADIKFRAAAYYLDLQRSYIFKALMLKDIADQEKQLTQIKALKNNGVVLKSDVLRAELKLSRQKMSLVQIDNDIAIANQRLDIMIGLADTVHIDPVMESKEEQQPLLSYQDYLAEALKHSYPFRISEKESELSLLKVKAVKANVAPKVGLFADYAYTYPQIMIYPYAAAIYGLGMAGIKASFPISAFYHNKHKAKAAEIDYKRQEIAHADTEDKVREQVNEAYLRYKEALIRITVAKTNIEQATENRRIVSNTYFNQLSLLTDLLDADTQLLQTRFDLAAAQINAQLQYFQLQKAIGNL